MPRTRAVTCAEITAVASAKAAPPASVAASFLCRSTAAAALLAKQPEKVKILPLS
jgi:hypothetical protein